MSRISRRHSTVDDLTSPRSGLKSFLGRIVFHDPWHFPRWASREPKDCTDNQILRPPQSFSVLMEQQHLAAVIAQSSSWRESSTDIPQLRHSALPLMPSRVPAIRKGSDGQWIPPTLAQGSLSTTALERYSGREDTLCGSAGKKSSNGSRKARNNSLSVMFTGSGFTNHSIEEEDMKTSFAEPVSGLPKSSSVLPILGKSDIDIQAAAFRKAKDAVSMPPPPLPNRISAILPRPGAGSRLSSYQSAATQDSDETQLREDCEVRGRRMSERTLQDARLKILGQLSQQSGSHDQLVEAASLVDTRREAISRSLAHLEGRPQAQWQPSIAAIRPTPVRSPSVASSHTTLEDLPGLPASPSGLLRRPSGSGKIVIPKRALSPPSSSSGLPATPVTLQSAPPLVRSHTSSTFLERPPSAMMERRQSEGSPGQHEAPRRLRPLSMVNLAHHSPLESLSRSTSRKADESPQILSFGEGSGTARYQLGNCIGRGQFGSVYRSLNLANGQMVAIKRIRLAGMTEREVREVMREVEVLQRLKHPSIVRYEGMSRDDEYLNIVLEFVENGSLGQTLKSFGSLNEKLVASYVWKILEGLQYLHSSGVVHCDLKAANILSTKNGNIKLSDFGVSLNLRAMENMKANATFQSRPGRPSHLSEIAGTPNWMAPEVITLMGASPASDIWSLGCTIIELLTGKPPYSDVTNGMSVLFRIVEDEMPPLPPTSPPLTDFLQQCFTKSPKRRPTAQELFKHAWLADQVPYSNGSRLQDSIPLHVRSPRIPKSELPSRYSSLTSITDAPASPKLITKGSRMNRVSLHERLFRGFKNRGRPTE